MLVSDCAHKKKRFMTFGVLFGAAPKREKKHTFSTRKTKINKKKSSHKITWQNERFRNLNDKVLIQLPPMTYKQPIENYACKTINKQKKPTHFFF